MILRLDLVSGEEDSLAEEVRQNVVSADKLHFPLKRVQDVGFHNHEFIIREGSFSITFFNMTLKNVFKKLHDSRVRLLVIFGRDKNAGGRD